MIIKAPPLKQSLLYIQGRKFTIHNLAPSYDRLSKDFTNNFNLPLQNYLNELLQKLDKIANTNILDLGCGTAWLGKMLFSQFAPAFYHGIDISTGMIYQARKNLMGNSQVKLEHGNFLQILDFIPKNSYDLIFLNWSLKFNNSKILLNKILNILKPGGRLALLTETIDSDPEITQALNIFFNKNKKQINLVIPKTYLPENSRDLTLKFNETGFKQTIVWNKSETLNFSSSIEASTWAVNMGIFAGWDQVVDIYEPQFFQELTRLIIPTISGKWLITRKILLAIASK